MGVPVVSDGASASRTEDLTAHFAAVAADRPDDDVGRYDPGYDVVGPTPEQLAESARRLSLHLDADQLAVFHAQVTGVLDSYRRVRVLPEPRPEVRFPRTPGSAPRPSENPHGAWAWRCDIAGASDGPLAGRTVAFKDNVLVAGVPTTNGSGVLDGLVPDMDATVVTRVLEAGGRVTGKATAEAFGLSSGSNTAVTGAVRNPRRPTHSTGGSSSGSAALVASGATDVSVGSDQGGSVRIPASLCGVVGLKPTFGLVPYTGVLSIEPTLDSLGPLGRTTADVALLLDVLAGADGLDPRQRGVPASPPPCAGRTDDGVQGLRVGVLTEGFGLAGDHAADAKAMVDAAIDVLGQGGATVSRVSVPLHLDAGHIVTPIYAEGIRAQMLAGGLGHGWRGYYPTQVLDVLGRVLPGSMDRLSDTGKLFLLAGDHMAHAYQGRFYARAQNLTLGLRAAYDAVLSDVDVLVMPTCAPFAVAQPLDERPGPSEVFAAAFGYHANTAAFNVTEHPALTVPCGSVDDLPVGVMIVGRHFDELTVLRAGAVIERAAE